MKSIRLSLFRVSLVWLFVVILVGGNMYGKDAPAAELAKQIDAFFTSRVPANGPGVAVLAVKEGKTILRKGYGMANIELGVSVKPGMVFRIGSITKQFTAAGIMMLLEQGKISLQDEITKFLPDYPVKGEKITVHHLLNHTSGIKSYTSMPDFMKMMRKDMGVKELVDVFKNEKMDFKPGEQYRYNNSGYILLGAIIEKVSGKSYEEFIDEKIFKALGMKDSYYGNPGRIIKKRAAGYKKLGEEFANADYLSMTLPYAAGSLLSTVDDLYKWTLALHGGKVVSGKFFKQMTTALKLNDGKTRNYGYGLAVGDLFKMKSVSHGGGINGFSTFALYLPEQDIFVSVLSNCPGNKPAPGFASQWVAALIAGKDVKEKKAVKLDSKILDEIAGEYKIGKDEFRTITREGDRLFSLRTGSQRLEVFAESKSSFFYKDSFSHFSIVRDKQGKVIKMVMHRSDGDEEAVKTDKKVVQRKVIKLDPKVFESYVGSYKDDKGMEVSAKIEGGKYIVYTPGDREFEVFPESETKFFIKVMDAQVEFVKKGGKVVKMILTMGPRTFQLKRQ